MKRALTLLLLVAAKPVAADPNLARIALGETVYADNCLECHGPTATEGEAGDIRNLGLATITGVVRGGMGDMPTVPLSIEQIRAVAAYLKALARR
jgi:mono/diheme cytochrome c family protein